MKSVKELLQRPSVRYLFVGGAVYALELLIIVVAGQMGATPVQSVAASYIIGTAVSFLLQKLVTFGDKRMHHKVLLPQIIAVCALVVFNFFFTLLVAELLAAYLPTVVTRTLALATTTVWNFYLYKTRIFKNSSELIT